MFKKPFNRRWTPISTTHLPSCPYFLTLTLPTHAITTEIALCYTPHRREGSYKMASSGLPSIPASLLADVTQFLLIEDVCRLYMSGSRVLITKLLNGGVRELRQLYSFVVPSFVLLFDGYLQHYSLFDQYADTSLFYEYLTATKLQSLPKSLISLTTDLCFSEAEIAPYLPNLRHLQVRDISLNQHSAQQSPLNVALHTLKTTRSIPPSIVVQQLAPSLTYLEAFSFPSTSLASHCLASPDAHLFPYLEHLCFRGFCGVVLPSLPNNLTRLHLHSSLLTEDRKPVNAPWKMLPPKITDLFYSANRIDITASEAALLNRSMTSLSLQSPNYNGFNKEVIEALPRALQTLSLFQEKGDSVRFSSDMCLALPPKLISLAASFQYHALKRNYLPNTLQNLTFGSYAHDSFDWLPPSLKTIKGLRTNPLEFFWSALGRGRNHNPEISELKLFVCEVYFLDAPKMTPLNNFPSTITELNLQMPSGWPNSLECLPRTLQKLEMKIGTLTGPPPPDWFLFLPQTHLEELRIPQTRFTQQQMSYLPRCEKLRILDICVQFDALGLCQLLPNSIEELDATVHVENWDLVTEKLPKNLHKLVIRPHEAVLSYNAFKVPKHIRYFEVVL